MTDDGNEHLFLFSSAAAAAAHDEMSILMMMMMMLMMMVMVMLLTLMLMLILMMTMMVLKRMTFLNHTEPRTIMMMRPMMLGRVDDDAVDASFSVFS